jgi:hypothetical protein
MNGRRLTSRPTIIRGIGKLAQLQIDRTMKQREIVRTEAAYLLKSPEEWTEVGSYSTFDYHFYDTCRTWALQRLHCFCLSSLPLTPKSFKAPKVMLNLLIRYYIISIYYRD